MILDSLRKIMKRTELNIAITGAVLGSVSAMSKLFPVMEYYSRLTVTTLDGQSWFWDCWNNEGTYPKDAWRDFIRWYHGRPQSSSFVMVNSKGSDMIRRCDIRAYSIRREERVKRTHDIGG